MSVDDFLGVVAQLCFVFAVALYLPSPSQISKTLNYVLLIKEKVSLMRIN